MSNFKRLVYISLLFSFFYSCATEMQRDRMGMARQKRTYKKFTGVRKKVAILEFFNDSPYGGKDLASVVTTNLFIELSKTGEFVFDQSARKLFGSSKEVYAGGGVKLVQIARRAKLSGINFVIFGRIEEARVREKKGEIGLARKTVSYTETKLEIRIFDVNSNKEVFNETIKGEAEDSKFKLFNSTREEDLIARREFLRYGAKVAVRRAVPRIMSVSGRMDWMGRVARIIQNKIYINAGRKSGIQIGDILKVITEGQEIYDPETGAMLGKSKGEVKGAIEVIDYFGPDGSICIMHSGGTVQEGDFVQLY